MSGFGGAFSAAMVGVVFVVAISSMTSISVSYLNLYPRSDVEKDRLYLSIDGGRSVPEEQAFLVNMTLLSGSNPVRLRDLSHSDIFIMYMSNGERICERIAYGAGWQILRVTVGGRPEFVNPIRDVSGMWDPGETVEISVNTSHQIDANSPWYFRFATNDGQVYSMSFGG